jgi:EAL and modified HD-GYP domain-containing signal transduction protein
MTPEISAFLPYIDVVKLDWPFISVDEAAQIAEAFHKSGKLVLAEKIETREDFTKAQDIGCDLFQGFFFTRPQLVKSSAASVNSATWLNLLDMALHDSSIDELERFLRAAPSLTVQLLRLANSISRWYLHISDLTSIRQGLALIGMERLARWCCFMLYGTHENNKTDPLVQLVRRRADFMERVTRKLFPNNERLRQEAYLSALLSLAHVPNGMDAQSFMSSVAVGPSIREAVLARGGWLGALLTVAECVEKGEYPTQKQLTAVYADGASLLDGLYL